MDALFNNMTIINNIALPLRLRSFSEKTIEKKNRRISFMA